MSWQLIFLLPLTRLAENEPTCASNAPSDFFDNTENGNKEQQSQINFLSRHKQGTAIKWSYYRVKFLLNSLKNNMVVGNEIFSHIRQIQITPMVLLFNTL